MLSSDQQQQVSACQMQKQMHTYKQQGWQQRTKHRSDNSKPTAWQQLTGVLSVPAGCRTRTFPFSSCGHCNPLQLDAWAIGSLKEGSLLMSSILQWVHTFLVEV